MKILHVMSEFPCPSLNGIRADIWDRIRAMCRLGHRIDTVVMKQKLPPEAHDVAHLRQYVNSLEFVERRPLRRCLATIRPTAVARNGALADLRLCREYDVTLAEGDDTLPIFENPRLQTKQRVLRVHNNEAAYYWAAGKTEENFLRKQFCRLEALRFLAFSRLAYRLVDSLWFISRSERQEFIASQPSAAAKAVWLPPSIAFGNEPKPCVAESKRVLFVASFYIPLNREALRWYLKHVHERLFDDPDYELVVAGSTGGRPSAYRFAEEVKRERRCSIELDVGDLTPLYNECAIFVNPMQRGAGVKLKNIHAIERRIPVVTTSVGNDGSGFIDEEHIRVADTPEDFASAIRELLNSYRLRQQLAAQAYCNLTKEYNCEANIRRLIANLVPSESQHFAPQQASC
jgi:polysaccharide biosynthesis protein PslH